MWVTENPSSPGGVKEKELQPPLAGGAVRFQGTIPLLSGGEIQDRTTLTPMADGRVHQVIEVSRDGRNWQSTFDAMYVKHKAG